MSEPPIPDPPESSRDGRQGRDQLGRTATAEIAVSPESRAPIRAGRDLRLVLIAGEHSGDALGGRLMAAINATHRGRVRYLGVGGPHMEAEGLISQFPIDEVAVMGPAAILRRLPALVRRVYQTAAAVVAAEPDALVIIDSPEFTHPIAKRVRRRAPSIPIIDYVSPSVWAWRPGRAPRMRAYVDHILALLPFEPAVHDRLGGPPCSYVGHPLIERNAWIEGLDAAVLSARLGLVPGRPVVVVLPGSRTSEVTRLMEPFGQAMRLLAAALPTPPEVIIPVVPAVRPLIEEKLAGWSVRPHLIEGDEDKFRAFKLARAALAASGTVTLELGLAGCPMVVAYRVDGIALMLRPLVNAPHFALSNLIVDRRAFPELMQEDCAPERLAAALGVIVRDGPERDAQLEALAEVPERLLLGSGTPSEKAAAIVLQYAANGRVAAVRQTKQS